MKKSILLALTFLIAASAQAGGVHNGITVCFSNHSNTVAGYYELFNTATMKTAQFAELPVHNQRRCRDYGDDEPNTDFVIYPVHTDKFHYEACYIHVSQGTVIDIKPSTSNKRLFDCSTWGGGSVRHLPFGSQAPTPLYALTVQNDAPILGATIRLLDLHGKLLFEGKPINDLGKIDHYPIPAADLHKGFRVEVSGGTLHGQPFQDKLMATTEHFDFTQKAPLVINIPQTLISRIYDRHHDRSLAEITHRVKGFLGVASFRNLEMDTIGPLKSGCFDFNKFSEVASHEGGLTKLLDKLEADIERGVSHTDWKFTR